MRKTTFKSPPFWWGYFCLWTVILTSRIRLRFTQRNQKVILLIDDKKIPLKGV